MVESSVRNVQIPQGCIPLLLDIRKCLIDCILVDVHVALQKVGDIVPAIESTCAHETVLVVPAKCYVEDGSRIGPATIIG